MMKILKRPVGWIFDTDNPDAIIEGQSEKVSGLKPLHHTTDKTDYDFISQYFIRENPIWENFGNSYFYCVSV